MTKTSTMLFACADELTDITKTANLMSSVGGGLKNALSKGWHGQGGLGQGITVATTGLQAPEAIAEQDPTGQNRSRGERAATIAGGLGGGLIGQSIGDDMGAAVAKKIDPTDKFKARAFGALDKAVAPPSHVYNNAGKLVKNKMIMNAEQKAEQAGAVKIRGEIARGLKDMTMKGMSPGARWANRGMRILPGAIGMGVSTIGMMAGANLLKKPFQWAGRQPPQPGAINPGSQETDQTQVAQVVNN